MDSQGLSLKDIISFPFQYKLWLLIQLDSYNVLEWNDDGTVILLNLEALESYLNSNQSIFKASNSLAFLEQLEAFQFKRLNAQFDAQNHNKVLRYKNENFQKNRIDLLGNIRCQDRQMLYHTNYFKSAYGIANCKGNHMSDDLCFRKYGCLSKRQTKEMLLQGTLVYQQATKILKENFNRADDTSTKKSQAKVGVGMHKQQAATEDKSVLINADHAEYAGYYGNYNTDRITRFFGDCLPQYEDGSTKIRKIIPTFNGVNLNEREIGRGNQSSLKSFLHVNYCSEGDSSASYQITPHCHQPEMDNFLSGSESTCNDRESGQENFSYMEQMSPSERNFIKSLNDDCTMSDVSKFINDVGVINYIDKNSNNMNVSKAADISKKRHGSADSIVEIMTSNTTGTHNANELIEVNRSVDTPHISDIEMGIANGINTEETEENFENFFSQYRSSMNILYDRF